MHTFYSPRSLALLGPAALLLFAVPAGAQVVYNSRTAFDTVNPGLTSFSFADLPAASLPPADGFVNDTPSLTFKGVTFSAKNTTNLFVIDKGFFGSMGTPYALDNSDFLRASKGSPTQLDIALPANTTAFGADFGSFPDPGSFEVLVNGQIVLPTFNTSNANAGSFFGYTSLTTINNLSFIEQTGNSLNVNDVEFGKAAPVPEASSLVSLGLMLALGTLTLGVCKRRRSVPGL